MYKYLLLNLVFMAVVYGVLRLTSPVSLPARPLLTVLAVMLLMTAVFDSLIIALNLVTYDTTHILGIYIGRAPIEDFCYTVLAAILVPILWERKAKK